MVKGLFQKLLRSPVVKAQRNRRKTSTSLERLECRTVLTPYVFSIQALPLPPNPNNGNVTSIPFEVTFDSPVSGVDPGDFHVLLTDSLKASGPITVTPVDANLDRYTVVVNGVTGSGDLRLDLIDNDSITDGTDPLADPGLFNGSFQGVTVPVLHTYPVVQSITRLNPADEYTLSSTVEFTVTFSQIVTGVTADNFQILTTGTVTTSNAPTVTGSGSSYVVQVTGVTGFGTLGLLLVDSTNSIRNAELEPLTQSIQAAFLINALPPESIIPAAIANEVELHDLNGDDRADLIFITDSTNSLSVALGNGDGTFQLPTTYETGSGPKALTIADINGDGRPDLLLVNQFSSNLSIYRGNGNGTFQAPTALQTNPLPTAITVGDTGSDGIPEIFVTSEYNASFRVYSDAGDGTFPFSMDFSTGNGPSAIALADVDSDGRIDVITADKYDDAISVLISNGDGGFDERQSFPVGDAPSDLAVGDINKDGYIDVVVANKDSDYVTVLPGNEFGNYTASVLYSINAITNGTGTANIGLSDLNNDGMVDIYFAHSGGTQLGAMTGDGAGGFLAPYGLLAGTNLADIAGADLNGDGRLDFVLADGAGGVTRLLNSTVGDASGESYTYFNHTPEIVSFNSAEVDENTPVTSVVLDVNAYDPDVPNQTLTFSLSGPDSNRFSIDAATGEIRFLASPDFEIPTDADADNRYEMTVTVYDGGGGEDGEANQEISIIVSGLNDNAPVMTSTSAVEVFENHFELNPLFQVTATDADVPAQFLSYSLSGADALHFTINGETHELYFNVSPDYEMPVDSDGNNVYQINITISDLNGLSTTQPITVTVLPSNDNYPQIDEIPPVEVLENTPASTVIVQVIATDADLPAKALVYELSGIDAEWFSIDPATGEVRFLSPPDYEDPQDYDGDNIYELYTYVIDGSEPPFEYFEVRVLPQNDNSPLITSLPFANVFENADPLDIVLDINATDADLPLQTLTYELAGADAALFTLDPDTGILRFNISPDYEVPVDADQDNAYELILKVSDSNGRSSFQNIAIAVQPVNDNSPSITSPAAVLADHNTPSSTVVLDVNAIDADAPLQALTYSLSGVDAELFSINSATGEIRFLASPDINNPLDAGGDNVYNFSVHVSDGGEPQLTATQEVAITVAILNSPPVVFDGLLEASEDTAKTGTLAGIDPNLDDVLTFSVVLSPMHGTLVIDNPQTGAYTYTPDLNYNGPDGFTFKASDGNVFSNVATVYITVTAVNDPPVATSTDFSLRENVSAGYSVGTVAVTDPDVADTRNFAISSGNFNGTFAIDPTTGVITVANNAALDFDARPTFHLVVTVTDSGMAIGTADITINVRPALVVTFPSPVPDYVPNGGPVLIDPTVEARDAEVPNINFREGTLTVTNLTPQPGDQLSIITQGNGPGKISVLYNYIVYESSLVIVGKIVSNPPGGPLVIEFTSFATEPAIDALMRAITFDSTESNPVTGHRTIQYSITDGTGSERDTKTKSINVLAPVVPPETPLFELSEGAVNYQNRTAPTRVDSQAVVSETQMAGFNGGRLTVAISQGPTKHSRLGLLPSFGITVKGRKVMFEGQVIGRLTLKQTSLTIDFNTSAATREAVQAAIRTVTFSTKNSNRDLTDRQLKFTLNDGHGQNLVSTKIVHVVDVS